MVVILGSCFLGFIDFICTFLSSTILGQVFRSVALLLYICTWSGSITHPFFLQSSLFFVFINTPGVPISRLQMSKVL